MIERPSTPERTAHGLATATPVIRVEDSYQKLSVRRFWRSLQSATPFGSNVALTIGGNVIQGLLALITGPLCARLLGPAGRGELAAIQNIYWLIATVAMLGLPEATLYFSARRAADPRRILTSAILFCFITYPAFYTFAYLLVPNLLAAQDPSVISTARWVLLGMPLYTISLIPQYSLRAKKDLFWWNLARIIPTMGWLTLLLFLAVVAKPTSTLFAFAYLGIFAVSVIPVLTITFKRIPGSNRPDPSLWGPMLKYGIPIGGSAIPVILNLRLDQMIMAAFVPARALGFYVVAVAWSATVPPVLLGIGSVLFPRVASAPEALRSTLLTQGARIGMAAALFLAISVAALTPFAIPLLFGQLFRDSVAVSVVLVFAAAISGMNIIFEEGLRGLGDTPAVFWSEAAGLAVTAVALALLLKPLGIMGAGVASILGYSATLTFLIGRTSRRTGQPLKRLLLLTGGDRRQIWNKLSALKASIGKRETSDCC